MSLRDGKTVQAPVDFRVTAYRSVKLVLVVAIIAFAVKYTLFDTAVIRTDQMAPALLAGDRVLLLRTPFAAPLKKLFTPGIGSPVVLTHPLVSGATMCLRVAGLPGDSVTITKGVFSIVNKPGQSFGYPLTDDEELPSAYSPRDTMRLYRIPIVGDTLPMDSLSLRDFFFSAAIIKQENPRKSLRVRPLLFIDEKPARDFILTDFSLYKGSLDTIPQRYDYDWFFWDRLRQYCSQALKDKNYWLDFGLFDNTVVLTGYRVKKSCIFLLADDWRKGFDSRYFGPVPVESIRGRPLCVLWSWAPTGHWIGSFRMGRLIKLVK